MFTTILSFLKLVAPLITILACSNDTRNHTPGVRFILKSLLATREQVQLAVGVDCSRVIAQKLLHKYFFNSEISPHYAGIMQNIFLLEKKLFLSI